MITSLCSLLTVFLICQELFNYVVEKPTITSMEEKVLRSTDIPETVICAEPGFDSDVLEKYGYSLMYYRGSMNGQDFVGWNGRENESNSAHAIQKEALLADNYLKSLFPGIYFEKEKRRVSMGELMEKQNFELSLFPLEDAS